MTKTRGTAGQRRRAAELIRLARAEFKGSLENGRDLKLGEVKMLRGAAMGEMVDLTSKVGEDQVVRSSWTEWGAHRIIRSAILRWVSSTNQAKQLVDPYGIRLQFAKIINRLVLDGVEISFPFWLSHCAVPDGITAPNAKFAELGLNGSFVKDIYADGAIVAGSLNLRHGFYATGEVHILGVQIGGDLDCSDGSFENSDGDALSADRVRVMGDVSLADDFHSKGNVRFLGAIIQGDLTLGGIYKKQVQLGRIQVRGTIFYRSVGVVGSVDLTSARIGYLVDVLSDWPKNMWLTDFEYKGIHPHYIGKLHNRLAWLASHDSTCANLNRFDPQPYRQLAKVLRHSGYDQFADSVMYEASKKSAASRIHRQREQGTLVDTALAWVLIVLNALYIGLVGHGYKRIRPFVWMFVFVVIGGFIFSGFRFGDFFGGANPTPSAMQQTQGLAIKNAQASDVDERVWVKDYPAFRPLAYSADAFLPLVNLHQESYWTPKDSWVKSFYLPFHILGGWVVTTLAAVSVTGLVRHEKE
tara:strand:- start:526 stop:2103 length:1578 start_codon:yes stop_codon:yes gene_type:complete